MSDKLKKDDLKFLVQVNLANRDFLINCAQIRISMTFSFVAFLISLYGLSVSVFGLNSINKVVGLVVAILCIVSVMRELLSFINASKKSARFNAQYQKYYFKLFPKLRREYH